MIELTAVGPMVACLQKKIILRKSSPRRFTWWFPGGSMWSQELCLRKAHIEVEGRLMGHILTEFIQQIFPLLFQRTLMYKQRIDICEYRQSCTYMRNIWNFLWVMLQFCKRIHNFGWGNSIHLQHSWLWCWRFWRWQKIHAGCLSCCMSKSTQILSLYLAKFECWS